jgi:hypothetical protein
MIPRDPTEVINTILKYVPENGFVALRSELERIKSNACFVAPEAMQRIWLRLGDALDDKLNNPPKYDWEVTISDIMRGNQMLS